MDGSVFDDSVLGDSLFGDSVLGGSVLSGAAGSSGLSGSTPSCNGTASGCGPSSGLTGFLSSDSRPCPICCVEIGGWFWPAAAGELIAWVPSGELIGGTPTGELIACKVTAELVSCKVNDELVTGKPGVSMDSWTVSGSPGMGTRKTGSKLDAVKGEVGGTKAVISEVELVATLALSSVTTFGGAGIVGLTPGKFVVELLSVGRFACTAIVGLATAVIVGGGEKVPTEAGGATKFTGASRAPSANEWLVVAPATAATGPVDKSRRNSSGSA